MLLLLVWAIFILINFIWTGLDKEFAVTEPYLLSRGGQMFCQSMICLLGPVGTLIFAFAKWCIA